MSNSNWDESQDAHLTHVLSNLYDARPTPYRNMPATLPPFAPLGDDAPALVEGLLVMSIYQAARVLGLTPIQALEHIRLSRLPWVNYQEQPYVGVLAVLELLLWRIDHPEETETGESRTKRTPIPQALRWAVFKRDDFRCRFCGSASMLEADHIFPESRGGATTLDNLQTLCRSCNARKGAR